MQQCPSGPDGSQTAPITCPDSVEWRAAPGGGANPGPLTSMGLHCLFINRSPIVDLATVELG
jgi:hypothetical protein